MARTFGRILLPFLIGSYALPAVIFAQTLPAGFAPGAIFVSKTNVVTGDSVSIFTVLYNASDNDLTGDVVFTVDGQQIGTKNFSLSAGETQTPSVSWTATEGSHQISAHLENIVGSDAQIALQSDTTDTIALTAAPPPPPSAAAQTVQQVTNIIQEGAQSVAPVTQTAVSSLENLRENAVQTLTEALATSSTATPTADTASSQQNGQVLGTSTYRTSANTSGSGIFSGVWRGILQILLAICQIQILFYFVLLIVLFILYKLVRALFAERH